MRRKKSRRLLTMKVELPKSEECEKQAQQLGNRRVALSQELNGYARQNPERALS